MTQARQRVQRDNDARLNDMLGNLKTNPSPVAKKALKGHEKVKNEHHVSTTLPDEGFRYLWARMKKSVEQGIENFGQAFKSPSLADEARGSIMAMARYARFTENGDGEGYVEELIRKDLESDEPLAKQF